MLIATLPLCLPGLALAQDTSAVVACKAKASDKHPAQYYEIGKAVYDVRKLLFEQKPDEALPAAKTLLEKFPSDSNVQAVLGEVYYRRGELSLAVDAINKAILLDACNARAHYDAWQFLTLTGMRHSALQQLTLAHGLDEKDTSIDWNWKLEQKFLDPEFASNCRLVSSTTAGTIPLDPRGNSANFANGATLEVSINGKRTQLILDSGDPGITLSAEEASRAGILPERNYKTAPGGATGSGSTNGFVSHIKTLQVGPFTFENCPVDVVTDPPVRMGGFGPKILHDFLITLDVKHARIDLSPLPPLPPSNKNQSPGTSDLASQAQDRYIAPSMSTWLRFYQPFLLDRLVLPVRLGNAGQYLFILDSGAPGSHIDQDVAREVTTVTRDFQTQVAGYGGIQNEVYKAESVPLRVGNITRTYAPMLAYTRAAKSEAAGVRIAGDLGFDLVRDLVIRIDYRDLLIDLQPNGEEILSHPKK
jgi:hypothetical protein